MRSVPAQTIHIDGQEVGFEVAVGRRQWADAVEGYDDGLCILQVEEDFFLEKRFLMFLVLLRGGTEPLFDDVRPESRPTLALVLDSETM